MRTRREINNEITYVKEQRSIWESRAQTWRSSWTPQEMDDRVKFCRANIDELNRELLAVVEAELATANNRDAELYGNINRAAAYNHVSTVAVFRKERRMNQHVINNLNRERRNILTELNQENNMPGAGRNAKLNQNHDIDESVTTPGTDPEAGVKQEVSNLKAELVSREAQLRRNVDATQAEIDRLQNLQAGRRAKLEALNIAIDAL